MSPSPERRNPGRPTVTWDGLCEQVVRWLLAHQEFFLLPPNGDDARTAARLKPIGELALTAEVLSRQAGRLDWPWLADSADILLHHSWRQLGDGELLASFLERHPDLLVYATVVPPFVRHGFRSANLESTISEIVNVRGFTELEYPAWRALDLAVALDDLGLSVPWTRSDLVSRTWLASRPEPWALGEDSAYAVTHTAFYLTRFGAEPEGLDLPLRGYLARWAPAWQRFFARRGNDDLLGEMTMALRCIGVSTDGLDVARHLADVAEPDGAIPGPSNAGWSICDPEMDATQRRFLQHYHTTLVAAMACAMSVENRYPT